MNPLINKQCRAYSSNESPLNLYEVELLRQHTPQWQYCATENELCRTFKFKDFHQTMAFINQVADVAHEHNHHPDIELSYNRCKLRYSTHTVNGMTENDFICAYQINQIQTT